MSEVKLSTRAEAVLSWIKKQNTPELAIRQASLAEELACSRWSIGRALRRLKEAELIVDLERRHENRCKLYRLVDLPAQKKPNREQRRGLTGQAQMQLDWYRPTFELVFQGWPDWEQHYEKVTWELEQVTNVHELWRQTFDALYGIGGFDY